MFRKHIFSILGAIVLLGGLTAPVLAAEVDCDSVYCFCAEDFSAEEGLAGVCITDLPESRTGTVMLGSRVLRTGDILTAEQVSQMTFSPIVTADDAAAEVGYLPIYADRVEPPAAVTIAIRGKEDKPPVAEDTAAETYKNLPATGMLKVRDPEGQALTFTVTRPPKRGSVTIGEDGCFTYTPKKNKVGVDSFTYTAANPAGKVSREATVVITILKPTDAAQYTDTMGQSCRFAAEWMKNSGIFVGETLGSNACFSPEKEVSRGEFVTMLVKSLNIPTEEALSYTGYSDEIPDWLRPYLAAAVRSGLTAGLPDQETFGANTPVTGAEAAVMLQNALSLTVDSMAEAAEETDAPAWAQNALTVMNRNGIALNTDILTRAQTAEILYQAAQMHKQEAAELFGAAQ